MRRMARARAIISVSLPIGTYLKLKEEARRRDCSMSALVRAVVEEWLEREVG